MLVLAVLYLHNQCVAKSALSPAAPHPEVAFFPPRPPGYHVTEDRQAGAQLIAVARPYHTQIGPKVLSGRILVEALH